MDEGAGNALFSYSVANSLSSTVGVEEFDLAATPGSTLSGFSTPAGFLTLYTQGDPDVQFLSTDPSTDIAPGASGVFSFTSDVGPAPCGRPRPRDRQHERRPLQHARHPSLSGRGSRALALVLSALGGSRRSAASSAVRDGRPRVDGSFVLVFSVSRFFLSELRDLQEHTG